MSHVRKSVGANVGVFFFYLSAFLYIITWNEYLCLKSSTTETSINKRWRKRSFDFLLHALHFLHPKLIYISFLFKIYYFGLCLFIRSLQRTFWRLDLWMGCAVICLVRMCRWRKGNSGSSLLTLKITKKIDVCRSAITQNYGKCVCNGLETSDVAEMITLISNKNAES